MKQLSDMNQEETKAAYDASLRNHPVGFHLGIERNPMPRPGESAQVAHVKSAYKQTRAFESTRH